MFYLQHLTINTQKAYLVGFYLEGDWLFRILKKEKGQQRSLSPWVDNCRIGMMRSSIYASVTLLIVTIATIKSRDLTRSIFGLARSILALRDQFWPCKIVFGLSRSILALRVRFLALQHRFLALRIRFWPCEKTHGLARRPIAMREGP